MLCPVFSQSTWPRGVQINSWCCPLICVLVLLLTFHFFLEFGFILVLYLLTKIGRSLGHVTRTDGSHIPKRVLYGEVVAEKMPHGGL